MKTTSKPGEHATEKKGPQLHHRGLAGAEDKPQPVTGNASLKPEKRTRA